MTCFSTPCIIRQHKKIVLLVKSFLKLFIHIILLDNPLMNSILKLVRLIHLVKFNNIESSPLDEIHFQIKPLHIV